MEYKNKYLRRNEYFGLIWMAAHRPTKLNKVQVLHLDLAKKCKYLTEMVINSQQTNGTGKNKNMKPKFSLLISSHLMKGLVTILLKKNKYLYDELVNLKNELSRSYTLTGPKQRAKAPKKVDVIDKSAITLKENIPDMMDISSIDSMIFVMDNLTAAQRHRNCTMLDTDDLLHESELIPIDYDYTMDSFGITDVGFAMPIIDDYTMAKLDAEEKAVQSLLEDRLTTMPQAVTSTIRKPDHHHQASTRIPFSDVSNIPELMRDEESLIGLQHNIQTTIAFEDFSAVQLTKNDQLNADNEVMMPNLFEPTVMEDIQQPHLIQPIEPERIYEMDAQINELTELPTRGLIRTFSADINALKEEKRKKLQAVINRKRRNLIIDQNTTLYVSDLEKQKRSSKSYKPGSKEYNDQLAERQKMFLENSSWLKTKHDYFGIDLIKEPSGLLAKRTKYSLNSYQQSLSVAVDLTKKFKSFTSVREIDDENFYLSQVNNNEDSQKRPDLLINESSIAEKVRKYDSNVSKRLSNDEVKQPKLSKRQSSIMDNQKHDQKNNNQEHVSLSMQDQMELPLPLMNMEPFESLPIIQPIDQTSNSLIENNQPVLIEISKFEEIILEAIDETEFNQVILQDLIQSSIIPEKCYQMQKPRKFFACKMMNAALNLAMKQTIKFNQNTPYGSILIKNY